MSITETPSHFLITGANSYLGTQIAQHLASNPNNRVFTTSRRTSVFETAELGGNQCHLSGVDLLKAGDMVRLAVAVDKWTDEKFHIVNCVGYFPGYKSLDEIAVAEARQVFDSNVLTLYSVAHTFLPLMRTKGGGHFIAFSSHAVSQSYPLMGAFLAAKAAVDSLVQSIANEGAKDGIVANALAIATLDTPRERDLRPDADNTDWLHVEQIVKYVNDMVRSSFGIMNGNTIHLYNYSEAFFHKSFFDRLGTVPKQGTHCGKTHE